MMLENDASQSGKRTTVLFQPHWHKGVIGIVASRLMIPGTALLSFSQSQMDLPPVQRVLFTVLIFMRRSSPAANCLNNLAVTLLLQVLRCGSKILKRLSPVLKK
jgi:hypothetical protein